MAAASAIERAGVVISRRDLSDAHVPCVRGKMNDVWQDERAEGARILPRLSEIILSPAGEGAVCAHSARMAHARRQRNRARERAGQASCSGRHTILETSLGEGLTVCRCGSAFRRGENERVVSADRARIARPTLHHSVRMMTSNGGISSARAKATARWPTANASP